MIKLKEFLTPLENFQYSVNLEYDLNDIQKMSSYIPTGSALEIIEDIILSTNAKSSDRARILTGAYGKGKSHLTLALLGILSGKDRTLFQQIVDKADEINARIAGNIRQYFDSGLKLLPVLLNSQSTDLKATILQGLHKSLKRAELSDVMPSTFFDAAIHKISDWQRNYPDTFKAFSEKIDSPQATIDRLKVYDSSEYHYFTSIYPSLTSGSEFNPLLGSDVISTLESVVDSLKKKNYNGIFIVYDEFSKFLDGNIETGSAQNVKLLQDMAERCNRSGSQQIHLLLISHKNIENYVGHLPKKIIDDWKGISRRFKPVTIDSSVAELFEMIAAVLKKDNNKFGAFINEIPKGGNESNAEKLKALEKLILSIDIQDATKRSAFADVIKHTGIDFVKKCYPLHPYSLLLLPKISELVAQNERTIFTFLASDEKYAVKHFVRTTQDSFPLIEPDQIYDYFEQQFKGEPYGSEIRRQWQIASTALNQIAQENNKFAEKIIKTISILYIVNQFDVLPPSLDLINEIYNVYSIQEFNAAINAIRSSGLLIELEYKPYVRIREISGNNADELVATEIEKTNTSFNIRSVLRNSLPSRYLYPSAYNDKFELTRYFEIIFIDYKILHQTQDIKEYITNEKSADGYVFAVVVNDEFEYEESIKEIKRLGGNRVVFALPKTPIDISKSVVKYTAIQNILCKGKNLTSSTIDELRYIENDLRELIDNYIDTCFFSPELHKTDYFYSGEQVVVHRRTGLLALLSEICEKVFSQTPIIINENINREKLSSPMKATRLRILDSVLQPNIPANFGLSGSQDINVARSIYLVPRIVANMTAPKLNTTEGLDENFSIMFWRINQFLESAMITNQCFSVLYKILKNPDDGMALRSGVIPFYITVALAPYRTFAVLKRKNKEVRLTGDALEAVNECPEDFSLSIENWTLEKTAYIAGIEKAISNFVSLDEREFSSFSYIITALQKWYLHLTRFDRDTKRICDGTTYRSLSKFETELKKQLSSAEINAHEFLFERLPKIAGENNYASIVRKFQEAIVAIENNSKNVIEKTLKDIKRIFNNKQKVSLNSIFLDYYDALNDKTKRQVFSGLPEKLLETIRQHNKDDNTIVLNLIKNLAGLRLDDFGDSNVDCIEPMIIEAKATVDKFNTDAHDVILGTDSGYEITFIGDNNTLDTKHISSSKLPEQARAFANEIETLFEEYGESLTTAQKAQVFLEVLKKNI